MSTKQDHKRWRKQFNEDCLKRDGNKCVFCGETEDLDVHHITDRHEMPNGGYVMSNGITVCNEHHLLCEEYHRTSEPGDCFTGDGPDGYSPNDCYNKINSSWSKAFNDSENLK